MNKVLLPIALIFLLFACKTARKVSQQSDSKTAAATDTLQTVEPDSVYLITQKGDTLSSLNEEVEIPTYRLLPDTITIAAVGDIMTGTNFPNTSYLPADSGRYLWEEVRPVLKKAYITFGNLEGTVLNDGGEQKECSNPKLCYLFRSPEYLAENFRESGFDLMSVANNHANDFGQTGRQNNRRPENPTAYIFLPARNS